MPNVTITYLAPFQWKPECTCGWEASSQTMERHAREVGDSHLRSHQNSTRIIYRVEKKDGSYKKEYRSDIRARAQKRLIILEGVDGDEEENTVTYWYRLRTDDDE